MPTAPATARALTGVFGRVTAADRSAVGRAVGARGDVIDDIRLYAATDAAAPGHGALGPPLGPRCLLAGALYCLPELARDLGEDPAMPAEALLALGYTRWNAGLLTRLRGDFTLLVWDASRGEGLIARDQLGTGSLYYHQGSGHVAFATEVVELLALLSRRPEPDDAGVVHWLTANASRPDIALYGGVRQLPPAWCLRLDRDGWTPARYWEPRPGPYRVTTRADALAAVTPLLEQAVARRLDDAAPTGVLTSGGLDSTAVAAIANRARPGNVLAFSEVFPEHAGVDESRWIDGFCAELGLPSTRIEVGAQGLVQEVVSAVERWALPPLSHNFWGRPLYEHIGANHGRVLLTGDGGDELFAIRRMAVADRLRRGRVLGALSLTRRLPGTIAYPPWRPRLSFLLDAGLVAAAPPALDRVRARMRPDPFRRPRWLTPYALKVLDELSEPPGDWKRCGGPRSWADLVHRLFTRVPALGMFDELRRVGRSTGVELRTPLFDLDLIELVLRIDPRVSFDATLSKPVLRAALDGRVPDQIRLRPRKTYFNDVLIDAVRGPDRPQLERLLDHGELRRYVRPDAVRDLLDHESQPGVEWQHAQTLWRLLGLECWLRAQEGPDALRRLQSAAAPRRFTLRPAEVDPAGASGMSG